MCFEEKTPREFFLLNWTERKNEMFEHKWHGVIAFQMSVDKLRDPTKIIFESKWRCDSGGGSDERRGPNEFLHFASFILSDYYCYYFIQMKFYSRKFLSHFVHIFFTPSQSLIFHSFDCSVGSAVSKKEKWRHLYIKIESLFIMWQSLRRISITRTFLTDVL